MEDAAAAAAGNPFARYRISSHAPLDAIAGRRQCPGCSKKRKHYCYDCLRPMNPAEEVPRVELPCDVHVIKHPLVRAPRLLLLLLAAGCWLLAAADLAGTGARRSTTARARACMPRYSPRRGSSRTRKTLSFRRTILPLPCCSSHPLALCRCATWAPSCRASKPRSSLTARCVPHRRRRRERQASPTLPTYLRTDCLLTAGTRGTVSAHSGRKHTASCRTSA
jgi:hypothetical protein